ncbi:polymer-forming cytoskeletal protein [bacterium AH-315-O15]|nr:polymer-forming cytoskeletal protein [bacterium AH-315-O15]
MFELNKKESSEAETGQSPKPTRSYRTSSAVPEGNAAIGRSIKIVGDLRGDEDLRIEGDIDGTIQLPNYSLTIGTEGRINADAYAKSVVIDGEINGDVHGSECVTVRSKARVVGNIVSDDKKY